MSSVIVVFKIMPKSMENFDSIMADVKKLKPKRLEEELIAFGLKAIKATFIIPDEEGTMSELEKKVNALPNIQSAEAVTVSRSL